MSSPLQIAVLGAGKFGSAFAFQLARTGEPDVTVIGAGMGGLNAALQLHQAGFPVTVIEKNAGVGGTWWETRCAI